MKILSTGFSGLDARCKVVIPCQVNVPKKPRACTKRGSTAEAALYYYSTGKIVFA